MITEDQVHEVLKQVKYPGFSRDIISFGLVKNVRIDDDGVYVQMAITATDTGVPKRIKEDAIKVLEAVPGIGKVTVKIDIQMPVAKPPMSAASIEGVSHVIAVASGKGGVGKSTVASNLASALAFTGAKVGLCDCDIYGPSMALMFGSKERPMADENDRILPVESHGIRLMSMGFLLDDDAPAVLRGPMVTRYTQQFLRQVAWGELDYLVLDLPPGTGDIQLTIVQTVALAGAIVVTTPQEVALVDVRKAVAMFHKTNVPILGIIENMSYFLCPSDGIRYDIFGSGGGEREAARLDIPLLGEIPIDIATREAGDLGRPIVDQDPNGPVGSAFVRVANILRNQLEEAPVR